DDLFLVENLELPTAEPQHLLELAQHRRWGHSVLMVDVDEPPENLAAAVAGLRTINFIPAIGLNVHSLLKHQGLVLTLSTLDFLEKKLLWHDRRYSALQPLGLPHRDWP
ncbi:RM04 protein, partial [Alcedo cyanopectus]|nr:RM04 protein [Ceyx cyanopectus]